MLLSKGEKKKMAYISQERKKERLPKIKAILESYGLKGTVGIRNHMTLRVTIRSGELDLVGMENEERTKKAEGRMAPWDKPILVTGDAFTVNTSWTQDYENETLRNLFTELVQAMYGNDWYNNSDVQTDYFDIDFYLNLEVGEWDKPYKFTGKKDDLIHSEEKYTNFENFLYN